MSVARKMPSLSDFDLVPLQNASTALDLSHIVGFNKLTMEGIRYIGFDKKALTLIAEFDVEEMHLNGWKTLHGGMIAAIVDLVTAAALIAAGHPHSGMSADLSVSYVKAAPLGSTVVIVAEADKVGQNLLFARAALYMKSTGDLVATGRHTKFVGGSFAKL
ncbi:HotDog domain-containing protein [Blastocladiella britannica]|nr:HotDog domain-containing protein [Blastocladiella britannica]